MHIIGIALGVFGGLWLFVHWANWHENRWERREKREIRQRDRQWQREEWRREQATAALGEKAPWIGPMCISLAAMVVIIIIVSSQP
jgi:hypothetical protein